MAVSEKRYAQMLDFWDGNKEEVDRLIEEWGEDAIERGYGVFDFDGTGMLEISRIDDTGVFETEFEAVEQAIKDGIKIIPVDKLPQTFERRYWGWIDTPENRAKIKGYTERYC